mgnify:CR=1 FL=1
MSDEFPLAEVEEVADVIAALVRGGKTVKGAIGTLKYYPQALLEAGRKSYEQQLGIVEARDPAGIKSPSVQGWYVPPKDGKNWEAVKGYLSGTLPSSLLSTMLMSPPRRSSHLGPLRAARP